jgi:hypothetical protein
MTITLLLNLIGERLPKGLKATTYGHQPIRDVAHIIDDRGNKYGRAWLENPHGLVCFIRHADTGGPDHVYQAIQCYIDFANPNSFDQLQVWIDELDNAR